MHLLAEGFVFYLQLNFLVEMKSYFCKVYGMKKNYTNKKGVIEKKMKETFKKQKIVFSIQFREQ